MTDTITNSGAMKLRGLVDRIERLEDDKACVESDIKEVYAEAKSEGFDTKALRKVVAERGKDAAKREEEAAIFDLYWNAVQGELFEPGEITRMSMRIGDGPEIELDPKKVRAAGRKARAKV